MDLSVVLERGEDGMYVAHCPALKSCWSQGRTREEALRNIREAVELYESSCSLTMTRSTATRCVEP